MYMYLNMPSTAWSLSGQTPCTKGRITDSTLAISSLISSLLSVTSSPAVTLPWVRSGVLAFGSGVLDFNLEILAAGQLSTGAVTEDTSYEKRLKDF